jgi:hypothetical protein
VTTVSPTALRTFAFGDLDSGTWGVAAGSDGSFVTSFAGAATVSIDADGDGETWTLSGDSFELRFAPTTEPAGLSPAALEGSVQLCAVTGNVGGEEIECLGAIATVTYGEQLSREARVVSAWLGPQDGFVLAALRPDGAPGHDADELAGALFEDGQSLPLDEPRLSTTYSRTGEPSRASLELWLKEDEEDDEEHPHYPRRAAGETSAPPARLGTDGHDAVATLFRWHSRGLEGAGVYVLVPPR